MMLDYISRSLLLSILVAVNFVGSSWAEDVPSKVLSHEESVLAKMGFEPWRKGSCADCELYIHPLITDLRTSKVQQFLSALMTHKGEIQKIYHINSDVYDQLARLSIGILGCESDFFSSERYLLKESFPGAVRLAKKLKKMMEPDSGAITTNSRGPTQIKKVPVLIANEYGIRPDNLYIPQNAALATVGFLIESMKELKTRIVYNHLDFINTENYLDYLLYLYFGNRRALIEKTATPETNVYVQNVKRYMTWVRLYQRKNLGAVEKVTDEAEK